jgi:hypothetical protein
LKVVVVTCRPPRPVSFKAALKVASGDATWCGDNADAIRFTLASFYFSTHIPIKPFM